MIREMPKALRTTPLTRLLWSRLPERQTCSPEVAQLLADLNAAARVYHSMVTVAYRKLTPEQRAAVSRDPRLVGAEQPVRQVLEMLKRQEVNLFGFKPMDFCEAYVEVYGAYTSL